MDSTRISCVKIPALALHSNEKFCAFCGFCVRYSFNFQLSTFNFQHSILEIYVQRTRTMSPIGFPWKNPNPFEFFKGKGIPKSLIFCDFRGLFAFAHQAKAVCVRKILPFASVSSVDYTNSFIVKR